jgi:hypothetical protein
MQEPLTDQRERRAAFPSLAAPAARLVAAPACRGRGRQRSRGPPVDAARTRRRSGGPAPAASLWSAPAGGRRPAGASARAVAPRGRGRWLPGARVDLWPDGRRDAPGGGRLLSSRPCGPLAESAALEPTQARTAGSAARRRRHRRLAGGHLAGPHKGAQAQAATILFSDASGFSPWPRVVRTDAPIGHTPMLRAWWTRDHLAAISALSPEGQLSVHRQDCSLDADDGVALLEHLRREGPGPMGLLWDGAPLHRRHLIPEFLAHGAAPRLHVERLPADAPELNPGAGRWAQLKGVELRNWCGFTSRPLHHERRAAVKRVRRKPRIIHGCFRGAKL